MSTPEKKNVAEIGGSISMNLNIFTREVDWQANEKKERPIISCSQDGKGRSR